MTFSPILHLPQVAPNQNQKETTINTAFAVIEGSLNDKENLSLAGGNRTLSVDEFTKFFHQVYSAQTAARTVTIPATVRMFAVSNTGSFNITLHCQGSGGTDLVVPAGSRVLVLSDGTNVLAISQGVSLLSDLSDVVGALAASGGQLLGFDSTSHTWGPVDSVADINFFAEGVPSTSKKVFRKVFTRSARFFSDFNQSQTSAGVAATAAATFNVYKNATLVGTIHFAIGATVATYSTDVGSGSTSVSFGPSDVMLIQAPSSVDATLADISVTLKGVYL